MRNSGGAVDETAEGCFSNPFQELVCNDADSGTLVSALSYMCLLCHMCSVRGWLLGETNAAACSREGTFPRSKVCTVGVIGTPIDADRFLRCPHPGKKHHKLETTVLQASNGSVVSSSHQAAGHLCKIISPHKTIGSGRIEKLSGGPVLWSLFSEGLVVQVVPSDQDSRTFGRGCG
eukprot:scaffold280_cov391-Pavlova_lutheri.AAC.14